MTDIIKWTMEDMIEVRLKEDDDFLKVKETLTRIGIASRREKKLYQSCHILHKQGKYYIVHFKELFALDGKPTNLSENDIERRNTVVNLLHEWDLVEIVIPEKAQPTVSIRQMKILPFGEKSPLSVLVKDENSLNRLPPQVQTFVNSIKTKFFDDRGEMREPTREDFIEGKIGNRQFTRFLNLFYDLYPNMDPANDPLGGYGFIQSPPDVEKKKEPKFTTGAFKSKEDKKDKK